MQKYLVLYRSSMPAAEMMASSTPEQMQAGMEDWNLWSHSAGDAVIDLGSPLGDAVTIGNADEAGNVTGLTGYSILQADSADEVVKVLKAHPHLKTPGDSSITAIELLHIEGM